ncbi:MAG: MBL fold metallo-hydrolase, partial [Lachnospiraceae bacterium]|nr:MBL fold metallo-hydrolase [Lachnospiraceae bacterium]
PLDPRLLRAYDWGMRYFTEKIETRHLFPMHCWEEYKVCQKVKKEPWMQRLLNVYHPLEVEGQEWELC